MIDFFKEVKRTARVNQGHQSHRNFQDPNLINGKEIKNLLSFIIASYEERSIFCFVDNAPRIVGYKSQLSAIKNFKSEIEDYLEAIEFYISWFISQSSYLV